MTVTFMRLRAFVPGLYVPGTTGEIIEEPNTPGQSGTAREAPSQSRDTVRCPSREGEGASVLSPINSTSFSSLNDFSGIGSARETSAMLHPGAVDGPTASLAGQDSGDSRERPALNSGDLSIPSFLKRGDPDCVVTR